MDLGLQQAAGRGEGIAEGGALRAEAAAIGGMLGIAGDRSVGARQDAAADPRNMGTSSGSCVMPLWQR
jgi:hypothetical protein